jgi:flagellar basal-body rod protein FlgC
MNMASIPLAIALVLITYVGGCATPAVAPARVTLLNVADPGAAGLVAYLQLRDVPLMTSGGGETRIDATAQGREALIRFMELAQLRIETCAANIANMNTTRDGEGKPNPYRRRFVAVTPGGGSQTCLDESPFTMKYEPAHPDADAAGQVRYPNVDVGVEAVIGLEAARDYELAGAILQRLDPSIVISPPVRLDGESPR